MNGIIQTIDQVHIFLLRVTVCQYVTGRRYQKVRNGKQFILIIFDIPNIKKKLKGKSLLPVDEQQYKKNIKLHV